MNKKLLNTQIESLTSDHGAEIVKFYKSHGFNTGNYGGVAYRSKLWGDEIFYGVDQNGKFDNRHENVNSEIKTITLDEAKELVNENLYPKLMLVWDGCENNAVVRTVLGKFDKWYLAVSADRIEDLDPNERPLTWNHAKDIKKPEEVHISMQEIAQLKGCSVDQLRIKNV